MSTPKFFDGPNCVQTSLYGYDRNKNLQVNNLRGKEILVFRPDSHSGKQKKWTRSTRNYQNDAVEKESYPSYAHFHHQYTQPKPSGAQINSSFSLSSHDRNDKIRLKCIEDDQQNVRRVFDKLAINSIQSCNATSSSSSSSSSSCSSSYLHISSEVTHLQLNPAFLSNFTDFTDTAKNINYSSCLSISPSDSSSCKSLKNNRCSFNSHEEINTYFDQESCISEPISDVDSLKIESINEESSQSVTENEGNISESEQRKHRCPDEIQCNIFRNGKCFDEEDERKQVLKWYDDLIQWRHDIMTKRRFGPPRCHPPPLTITMIGASRAQRPNPFQRVGEIHPFVLELMDHARNRMEARKSQNLVPYELPLPAPHEFMANAKCMEPHLFVEYCYQLTAAAYVDVGLNPPTRQPPIPPRIEPFPDPSSYDSIYSSASDFSSDGEYSDDSDETKSERLRQKMERHRKRENRLKQIFRRRGAENGVLEDIDEEDY